MRRINGWSWLGVLLITAVAAQPLWGAVPKGDDLFLHVYRIPVVNAAWAQGVFFSRWSPDLVYGYGSPLFAFYPPLSAYGLTAVYRLVGANAPAAVNLFLALILLATAVGMFLAGRLLFGDRGGLLAAALYTWSPHVLLQPYARASLSNALALAAFPWAVWGLLRVARCVNGRRTAVAALCVAAIFLSHIAASFLFLGPLLLAGLAAAWAAPERRRALAGVLAAVGLGLALSAFSWLPALAEIGQTQYAAAAGEVNYRDYFVDPLAWPPPAIAGLSSAPLPKNTGLAQLVLGVAATAAALWRLRRGKRPFGAVLAATAGVIGLGVLFLSTAAAVWLWDLLPPLQGLQFPWRLLDVPAFCLSLAGGFVGVQGCRGAGVQGRKPLSLAPLLLCSSAVLVAFANAVPTLYPPRIETLPQRPSLADVTAVQQTFGIIGLTAWGEYSSAQVGAWPDGPPFAGADRGATLAQKLRRDSLPPPAVRVLQANPWRAALHVTLDQDETLTFAVHDFPGWRAVVDGVETAVSADDQGRLQVVVPAGDHTVEIWFGRTPVRRAADGLSLLAGLVMGYWLLGIGGGKRPTGNSQQSTINGKRETDYGTLVTDYRLPVVLLALLLLVKIAWLDHFNTPLVVHPENGRIPGVAAPEWGDFGQVRLAGAEVAPPDRLTLYWLAQERPSHIYAVSVTLADARGVPVKTIINRHPGLNVTTTWEAGQLTRDVYTLPVAERAPPVGYRVQVSLLHPQRSAPLPLRDAPDGAAWQVEVGRLKRPPFDAPLPGARPLGTLFGEAIRLSETAVPTQITAGEALDFTLVWEPVQPVETDYTVFVHLLDADGGFVAGQDGQPLDGLYPTSYWAPGEVVADGRLWLPDVPPGEYLLQVGLYELATGRRLPVSGPQAELGDRVIVQTVTVGE